MATIFAGPGCGSARTIGLGGSFFQREVQPILAGTCGVPGCHGGGSPTLGLNLSEGQIIANTVNVDSLEVPELKRVKPGDSANSYLYQKISQETPAVGDRMPLGGSLTAEQIEAIRRWIDDGAQP